MGERVKPVNKFQCVFPAKSVNESFARTVVSSFVSQLDPRMDELADLKTAGREAVTNCIVHAYRARPADAWSLQSRTAAAASRTSSRQCSRSSLPTPKASAAAWASR